MIPTSSLQLLKEAKCDDPHYGLVENDGDYESAVAFANGASNLYAFRLHQAHPNLHHDGGYGSHDLRLAWSVAMDHGTFPLWTSNYQTLQLEWYLIKQTII